MKPEFLVEVLRVMSVREIADAWQQDEYLQILDSLEYGDTSDLAGEELRDMCFLSLQERACREYSVTPCR